MSEAQEGTTGEDRVTEILQEVGKLRERAKLHRDRAVDGHAPDEFDESIRLFQEALDLLKLSSANLEDTLSEEDRLRLVRATAHCHGSLGGTHRDAGDLDKAIQEYDAGFDLQQEAGVKDTYSELQRLLVRILKEPGCLELTGPKEVAGINVRRELRRIRNRLEKPMRDVRADKDDKVWNMADIAQLRILLGQPRKTAWLEFAHKNRSRDAYEANYKIYRALEEAGVTLAGVRDSRRWLAEQLNELYDFQAEA